MPHILVAEDDPRISAFLEKGFHSRGFTITVTSTGLEALDMASHHQIDLLILDLGLPQKDGLEVLKALRQQGKTIPIIILTARDDIHDKVRGLEDGANDYITKPFRFEELLARVRVQLRTLTILKNEETYILQARGVTLNLRTRKAMVNGSEIDLPVREFTMAELFFRNPEKIFSREQLLDHVWGYADNTDSNVVNVYVGYLRKKLGNDLIETVRGLGYRLRK